ncbi:alcohol dehydrogenase catalytic domain-containing protein [Streptomyces sp. NPDC050538]|uniref:alcohol dehydrogenase catalytic domain-containing protein n=1 Tax=Streptomyces sp. NPDC050538 TaxID=3365627 RepID=UPI00379EADCF
MSPTPWATGGSRYFRAPTAAGSWPRRKFFDEAAALRGGDWPYTVVYRRYGGPGVLELTELPEPKTQVNSMLIRVRSAGLNRADFAIQAGALDSAVETYFSVVPGWDVAGVVERAGPGRRSSRRATR